MTKARELADLIANVNHGSSLANKNFIINGNMISAQRGSVSKSANSYGYTLDQWELSNYIDDTITVTQDSDTPTGQGFANSMKITGSSGDNSLDASDYLSMVHKFEGQNIQSLKKGTSSAVPMTFSFWIKATTTGTYIVEFADNDNTRKVSKSYTVSSTNTWEYKTITVEADTTGAFADINNTSLWIQMWFAAGSNFTGGSLNSSWTASTATNTRVVGQVNGMSSGSHNIYLTGVQLEIGEKATEFEHEPYETTLAKCHRYFVKINDDFTGSNAYHAWSSIRWGSNQQFATVALPQPIRAQATVTITGTTGVTFKCDGSSDSKTAVVHLNTEKTGLVSFYGNSLSFDPANSKAGTMFINDDSSMQFDAEL